MRVQYSVFECRLARMQYRELRSALLTRIDAVEDAVAFYRLCTRSGTRVHGWENHRPARIRSS